MSNYLPGKGVRDIYVKDSGNDVNTGSNATFAVKTLATAVARVMALDPPPSLFNGAAIIDGGNSDYAENLVIPDNTQIGLQYSAIQGVGGITVSAGDNSQVDLLTISTSAASGDTGYSSNGKSRTALSTKAIILNGPNQIAISVDGASDQFFCDSGQILIRDNNSIAVKFDATGSQPRNLTIKEINIEGANCTAIEYNTTATEIVPIDVKAITDTQLTGNKGVHVISGNISVSTLELNSETAIHVESGATMYIFNASVVGDIIVDVGGTLWINTLGFEGNVVANGSIHGVIGGTRYGLAAVGVSGTGVVFGFELTAGSTPDKFNIAAGYGVIEDNSNPEKPLRIDVFEGPFVDVDVPDLGIDGVSIIAINAAGNITSQLLAEETAEFRRDNAIVGAISHEGGIVTRISNQALTPRENYSQFIDFLRIIGVLRGDGLAITPISPASFAVAAGTLLSAGAGNEQGNRAENTINIAAQSPVTFLPFLGITNTKLAPTDIIDMDNYDDGSGSPVVIPGAARAGIHYLFMFPIDSGINIAWMYPQTVYDNVDEAVAAADSDEVVIPEFYRHNTLLLARWVIEDGGDVTDPLDSKLLPGSNSGVRLGGGTAGAGGGGDFFGPASAVDGNLVGFSGTGGKIGEDSGIHKDTVTPSASGIFEGGALSFVGDTVSIVDGSGITVDNSVLSSVSHTAVSWSISDFIPALLASEYETHILIDNLGALVQQAGEPTANQFRTHIYLGDVSHPNGSVISATSSPARAKSVGSDLADLMALFSGTIIDGGKLEPSGANLSIKITDPTIFDGGRNWNSDPNDPNKVTYNLTDPVSFYYATAAGTIYSGPVTLIDPTIIDDGAGNITTISGSNDRATIQKVFALDGVIYIMPGQAFYVSLTNAKSNYISDLNSSIYPDQLERATFLGGIVVIKGAGDLSDPSHAELVPVSNFSGGSSSVSTFTGLSDTFNDYTGLELQALRVNAAGTGIEAYNALTQSPLGISGNTTNAASRVSGTIEVDFSLYTLADVLATATSNDISNGNWTLYLRIQGGNDLWSDNRTWNNNTDTVTLTRTAEPLPIGVAILEFGWTRTSSGLVQFRMDQLQIAIEA